MVPMENLKRPRTAFSPDQLATFVIQARLAMLNPDSGRVEDDEPFFVADLGQVHRQHQCWTHYLPTVQPFYGLHAIASPLLLFSLFYYTCLFERTKLMGQLLIMSCSRQM